MRRSTRTLRQRLRGQARGRRAWPLATALALAFGVTGEPTASAAALEPPSAAGSPAPLPADPREALPGYRLYHAHCYRCHGIDAVAGVLAPDLRRSVGAMSREEFARSTTAGRPAKGMPAFGPLLSADEVARLYRYLQGRASGAVRPGRPGEP